MPSKERLLEFVKDKKESRDLRTVALALYLNPPFPLITDLNLFAERESLSEDLRQLKPLAVNTLEKTVGGWVPRKSWVDQLRQRLLERLRQCTKIWVIHGRSRAWKEVGNYLEHELNLSYCEFNDPDANHPDIIGRVREIAATSSLAVAVMTAEDATADGQKRARQNVIHEIGLAQGRLGYERVLILREHGVEDFSNMNGLDYIPFDQAHVDTAFGGLRRRIEAQFNNVL
jgi:hypothetical protein